MLTIKSARTVLLIVFCLFSTMCWAETVYKSIDSQGNVTFSDKPMPGTAQVQVVEITPRNSPQKKQEVQKLEQQLASSNQPSADIQPTANNQQAQQSIPQRQQLLQQLKLAYAQLEATEDALAKAQKTANEQFTACLASSASTGGTVVCKANDVSPLQALVAEAQANVDKIKTQLDTLG